MQDNHTYSCLQYWRHLFNNYMQDKHTYSCLQYSRHLLNTFNIRDICSIISFCALPTCTDNLARYVLLQERRARSTESDQTQNNFKRILQIALDSHSKTKKRTSFSISWCVTAIAVLVPSCSRMTPFFISPYFSAQETHTHTYDGC